MLADVKWFLSGYHSTLAANLRRRNLNSLAIPLQALLLTVCFDGMGATRTSHPPSTGMASWYGEDHRGRLMANGKRFNPDKFTAASWFYPLGTRVRVTLHSPLQPSRSVVVKITDRGPAKELVRDGRVIDLALTAFKQLAHPDLGLVEVRVEKVK